MVRAIAAPVADGRVLPAASQATTRTCVAAPLHATRTLPADATCWRRETPFTRSVSNAGSLTQTRSGLPARTRTTGACVSDENGASSVAVPTASVASTETS